MVTRRGLTEPCGACFEMQWTTWLLPCLCSGQTVILSVSGTDFKTPKLHRTVRASDLSYQSHGDYQADYLTVEHNTVVDLHDEFILVGRETNTGKVLMYFHTYLTETGFSFVCLLVLSRAVVAILRTPRSSEHGRRSHRSWADITPLLKARGTGGHNLGIIHISHIALITPLH